MCDLEKIYKAFSLALEEELSSGNPKLGYRSICGRLKVSPVDLDEILNDELGMGGDEIVELFRSGFGKKDGQTDKIFDTKFLRTKIEN